MALTVTENSVRQINAALLSLEKKIGETNNEKAQDKQTVQMELKNVQYNFRAPLRQDGISVGLDTTGVWEGTARTATSAGNAITADSAETADKVKNALTINGKTYDGSSAINAGVQTVANGGTGKTTANDAANSFINSLSVGDAAPTDNDYFISQYVNGGTTSTSYHRRRFSKLWEYIKGKISSVLGLTATNYGGKASTAGTADNAYTAATARSADITRTLDAVDGDELQIGDGAKVHIVNTVHAKDAVSANITKTEDTVNGDTLKIGNGTAATITNAKHAATADKATKDSKGNNIVDTYATKTGLVKSVNEQLPDANGNVTITVDTITKSYLLDFVYPVGSIYMSVNNVSPQTFLGGTWARIQGRFLLGAGANTANTTNTYGSLAANAINRGVNEQGGEAAHELTIAEMPKHSHAQNILVDSNYSPYQNYPNSGSKPNEGGEGSVVKTYWANRGSGYSLTTAAMQATGSSSSHNNMPPYLVVYMWKRTA